MIIQDYAPVKLFCPHSPPPPGSSGIKESMRVIKKGGALEKEGDFWWLYRAWQLKIKLIRTPGQQQKNDVPGGARGGEMGAAQFDRRIWHTLVQIWPFYGYFWTVKARGGLQGHFCMSGSYESTFYRWKVAFYATKISRRVKKLSRLES